MEFELYLVGHFGNDGRLKVGSPVGDQAVGGGLDDQILIVTETSGSGSEGFMGQEAILDAIRRSRVGLRGAKELRTQKKTYQR